MRSTLSVLLLCAALTALLAFKENTNTDLKARFYFVWGDYKIWGPQKTLVEKATSNVFGLDCEYFQRGVIINQFTNYYQAEMGNGKGSGSWSLEGPYDTYEKANAVRYQRIADQKSRCSSPDCTARQTAGFSPACNY